jgi:SAM-dependent methyltransferase
VNIQTIRALIKGGTMERSEIFRDTKDLYLNVSHYTSKNLINFAKHNAGTNILDIGCATGEYCQKLTELGFNCIGIDINEKYVKKAIEIGVEAHIMSGDDIKFPDKSFDTILLFEVLEHVKNPGNVLNEAIRVAKKNILITVPNCSDFHKLTRYSLTYDHMLEMDHVNFFTKQELESLISPYSNNFEVKEVEPMFTCLTVPWWLKFPFSIFYKWDILKNQIYYRLTAKIEV